MTTVFIAGSISISRLHAKVQERINRIVSSNFDVVVGDADGADTSIQECLLKYQARRVTVYCTGDTPRNNVAEWPVHKVTSKAKAGTRAYFTAKDLEMARRSDYGLMVWDCKSTGTLSNVIELLKEKKKSVVFVNKKADFVNISDRAGLENLLAIMSDHARLKAEEKIGLSSAVASLGQEQLVLAPPTEAKMPAAGALEVDAAPPAKSETHGPAPAPPLPSTATPEEVASDEAIAANTLNMKLRTTLISALKEHISRAHLSQSQAAKVFGVTQPRISDLNREKVELFGLDALVNMAATAGLRVEMQVQEAASSPPH
ncbi:XRE family transcriptional regulator [Mesorhizobium sp. M0006]|uniref:helix-turn-helix domain-containing protein n=1 Tax=Mesorhizobium sp. M0006 TaxID=2956838 RepID=UPI0033368267